MTRFCVFYSLETGVVCLCIASILVSGGLICNHHFKIPVQIKDWRNVTIYDDSQLNLLELNTKIAIWVLASDILLTLLMLFPAAMTDVSTPWKKRNSVRKILIPCIIVKILCNLHGIAAIVWISWKFNYNCPEIIGLLLALALYVFLGWYVIVVVISYFLELGMRRTFHKLSPSNGNSKRGSQQTQISYQRAELANSDEIIPLGSRENGNFAENKHPYGEEEPHKSSKRKLNEHDKEDGEEKRRLGEKGAKAHTRNERALRSSRDGLDDQKSGSREALRAKTYEKEAEEREEQYRKLLNKSTWNQDQENKGDNERYDSNQRLKKEKQKSEENIRRVGPDGKRYRVSEKDGEGGGKQRYYYRTKNKSQYESPPRDNDDEIDSPERGRHRPPKYQRNQRDSEGSLESVGRVRSPPKYAPRQSQSDDSQERPAQDQMRYDDSPRRRPPSYPEPGYHDPRDNLERRYEEAPLRIDPDPHQAAERNGYNYQERQRYGSRENVERYPDDPNQSYNDYDYDGHDYVEAPPYVDTRYEDGYISSEV